MRKDPDTLLEEWADSSSMWSDYPSKLLRCYAAWLRNASPTQWHEAAEAWNWTYGSAPLYWIACQRDCDRATAVLIYYLSGPSYYVGFGTDVPESAREGHELITTIRSRVANGDYRRSEIAFDPRREFATEMRLAPISDDAGFPAVLPGKPVPRPGEWNDGFPDEVWSAARSAKDAG